MATYEIRPNPGDADDIRKKLAETGLAISLTESGRWFWGHKFVFTGSPEDLAAWRQILGVWDEQRQADIPP